MKSIIVPKNKEAERLLDLDNCPDEMLDEIQLSQQQFDLIWDTGLFSKINSVCGVLIDDFEDEVLNNPKSIEAAMNLVRSTHWPIEIREITQDLLALMSRAIEYKTGIYFYF